jgi:hypothetical protein
LGITLSTNAGTVVYQWLFNGTALSEPNLPEITFPNGITAELAGTYQVIASNECGADTSDIATLGLKRATEVTQQPEDVQIDTGDDFTLTVGAVGEGTLTYQWFKDGQAIAGADQTSYSVSNANFTDHDGQYHVVVTGECGVASSDTVDVRVVTSVANNNGGYPNNDLVVENTYPNPFNSIARIDYRTNKSMNVRIVLTNLAGRDVATLVDEIHEVGKHSVQVDATRLQLSSGTYIYKLITNEGVITGQMVLKK